MGDVIGLKVEHINPEDDASRLALALTDCIEKERLRGVDSRKYADLANEWDGKAQEMEELISRIRERDRLRAIGEEPVTTSRMDPMLTYDRTTCEQEAVKLREKSVEFRGFSVQYASEAQAAHTEMDGLQRKLRGLNEEIRKRHDANA